MQKHPDVIEAGVFGIPDMLCQELVTAVVIIREGILFQKSFELNSQNSFPFLLGSSVTEEEILEFVNSHVDQYNQVRGGLKFVPQIPRNPQGKILKNKLAHLFEDINKH